MNETGIVQAEPAADVKRFLLRYIVPFRIDLVPETENERSFHAVCGRLSRETWEPITKFDPRKHLYDYIIEGLRADGAEAPLGYALRRKNQDGAETRHQIWIESRKLGGECLSMLNESLVLFTTGIGFYWYDVHWETEPGKPNAPHALDRLLQLQQNLGNLAGHRKGDVYISRDGANELLSVWIRDFLRSQLGQVRFFESLRINGEQVPVRALRFADAVLDREDSEPHFIRACQLARGYNSVSVPGQNSADAHLEYFQGTCIHISREGCAYVASASAPEFNRGSFLDRFETCYFWIYLLMLQQSYGLKVFARRIAECTSADPYAHTKEMDRLLIEISGFLVRNEFPSVSDAHHINEYYHYGLSQLRIREESLQLRDGLNTMTQLQNSWRQLEESRREKISNDRLETGLAMLALLAVISALCDSVGLITGILDEHLRGTWWIPVALQWLLVVGIVVLAVFLFRGQELPHIVPRRKDDGSDGQRGEP